MVYARRWMPVAWCAVLALALAAGAAPGQEPEGEEGIRLSLDQTLRMALASNLDLVSARLDPKLARNTVEQRKAAYDVNLTSNLYKSRDEREIFSLFSPPVSLSESASVGITQQLPFGAEYAIRLNGDRSESTGIPLFELDPDDPTFILFEDLVQDLEQTNYGSGLSLEFTLPLAKGFGREVETESLVLARRELEISEERLRSNAHRVMEEVENAYWEVLTERENVRIAKLSLQRAEQLLALNRKKVDAGTLAPIEVTEAEAGVAAQVEQVILAETSLENAEDRLVQLLAAPADSPLWDIPIIPTDRPSFTPVDIDLDETIALALERRPEIINARRALANRELNQRVARRRTQPDISLSARVRPAGNNFELLDPGSDGVPGTFDDEPTHVGTMGVAIREIPEFENFNWSLSLDIAYPIRNRAAKASYASARLEVDKAVIDLRNQEQSIRVDVRQAVRNVDSGVQRVEAARISTELQRKKLDAEQRKFDNGMSTSFEVLSFQRDLANAELAEIRAALDYVKALTALERAKGTLLEARGFSLAE